MSLQIPASTKAVIYGFAAAAVTGVGGYLFGDFLFAIAPVTQATAPIVFALGGAVVGFFTGYASQA